MYTSNISFCGQNAFIYKELEKNLELFSIDQFSFSI